MKKKIFLCCICGIFIQSNLNNLLRHEKIHERSSKKIKCCACSAAFIQKYDYYRHWNNKHKEIIMPDRLDYVEEQNRPYRRKVSKKNDKTVPTSSRQTDFFLLNYLGLVDKKAINIQLKKNDLD